MDKLHANSKLWLFVAFLGVCAFHAWTTRTQHWPPGVLVPNDPVQIDAKGSLKPVLYKDAVLDLLAEYRIQARILSRERYYIDPMSKYSPLDLALGWGPMSDSELVDKLDISQGGRFYFYQWSDRIPASHDEMGNHSANVHILPADDDIEKTVKSFRQGELVEMRGHLVRVNFKNGSDWKSSLTRGDRGNGACEVFWVTYADRITPVLIE